MIKPVVQNIEGSITGFLAHSWMMQDTGTLSMIKGK